MRVKQQRRSSVQAQASSLATLCAGCETATICAVSAASQTPALAGERRPKQGVTMTHYRAGDFIVHQGNHITDLKMICRGARDAVVGRSAGRRVARADDRAWRDPLSGGVAPSEACSFCFGESRHRCLCLRAEFRGGAGLPSAGRGDDRHLSPANRISLPAAGIHSGRSSFTSCVRASAPVFFFNWRAGCILRTLRPSAFLLSSPVG